MVMFFHVFPVFFITKVLRFSHELGTHVQRKGRNSNSSQAEMIGSVIVARLRMSFRDNHILQSLSNLLHDRPNGGALGSAYINIIGFSPKVDSVVVKVNHGFLGRNDWVFSVILGTTQSSFLTRYAEKDNGTRRSHRSRSKRTS